MNARKARLKRWRRSDCAGSPTWRQEALPFSLSTAIRRGIPFVASTPIACPRETTDKRRTTTTNCSSSHHHDSAPSRPHLLICTGAEPIHPVHASCQLGRAAVAPQNEVIFCHFGGLNVGIFTFYWFPRVLTCSAWRGRRMLVALSFVPLGWSGNHVESLSWPRNSQWVFLFGSWLLYLSTGKYEWRLLVL